MLAFVATAVWLAASGRFDNLSRLLRLPLLLTATPHQAYGESLRRAGLAESPLGRRWFTAAAQALAGPVDVTIPRREAIWLPAAEPRALALRSNLRRGQRLVVEAGLEAASPTRIFIDVFEQTDRGFDHVASAAADSLTIDLEVRRDGRYVVRTQPELLEDARVTLVWRTEPTLQVPVEGARRPDIQSYFLAPRDGGRRDHHGVDIFARRGTPVVAAAGGIVSSVGTNALGGNVVWVTRPLRGERHYYAHLEEQLVTAGTQVSAGQVLGRVGTTGNARGGPPHLHFGIYGAPGPIDPLPYLEPAATAPPVEGDGELGRWARLRSPQRIPPASATGPARPLPAGTLVRVVGATARSVRVELPDGTVAYLSRSAIESATAPIQAIRTTLPIALTNRPGGVTVDVVAASTRLDVLGQYADSLYVRGENGQSGWIARPGPAVARKKG